MKENLLCGSEITDIARAHICRTFFRISSNKMIVYRLTCSGGGVMRGGVSETCEAERYRKMHKLCESDNKFVDEGEDES